MQQDSGETDVNVIGYCFGGVLSLLYASIFGGILTLAMIRFRTIPLPDVIEKQEWVKRLHKLDGGVPYGIALAASALLIYPETIWMKFVQ